MLRGAAAVPGTALGELESGVAVTWEGPALRVCSVGLASWPHSEGVTGLVRLTGASEGRSGAGGALEALFTPSTGPVCGERSRVPGVRTIAVSTGPKVLAFQKVGSQKGGSSQYFDVTSQVSSRGAAEGTGAQEGEELDLTWGGSPREGGSEQAASART